MIELTEPAERPDAEALAQLRDDVPVLLGPVRVETRFTATHLLVRVFPDDWQVDAFEERRTRHEHGLALGYWRKVWQAAGDRHGRLAAWRDLVNAVGPGRARLIKDARPPLNPGDEPRRTAPDEVFLVVAHDDPLPPGDRQAARKYWTAIYRAGGRRDLIEEADATLDGDLPPSRAAAVRERRPYGLTTEPPTGDPATANVRVSFLDLKKPADTETKDVSWTSAAKARMLPDRFTVLGYVAGKLVADITGEQVPDELSISPDPSTPLGDQLRAENGDLHIPDDLRWLTDFDRAVKVGMGFRIPLTGDLRGGLDRLVVLGVRQTATPEKNAEELGAMILRQARSRLGYRLLPQGTPTNNTGSRSAGAETGDEAEESFAAVFERPDPGVPSHDWLAKTDGQWLAELLGIDPKQLRDLLGADGTDLREARAMNTALWPATWGHHLHTMLNPMFDSAAVDETRAFFTKYVLGRGPAPTVQIGRQPYGILPTTAFSRLEWDSSEPESGHRKVLHRVLEAMAADWRTLAAGHVAHVGSEGDPHQILLDIVGLHPTSVEFHHRYAQSAEDYYNRLNLAGDGPRVINVLNELGMGGRLRELLTRLGYDRRLPLPDAATRLFTGRQHVLRGSLVDDRPMSEERLIRPYDEDGRNYLAWMAHYGRHDFEVVRTEDRFKDDKIPGALLYLMMRHGLLLAFHDAGLRLAADAHGHDEEALRRARKEAPFVHVSKRARSSESRWGRLYTKDPDVTGEPDTLVAEFIRRVVGQKPATRDLGHLLDAVEILAETPTARLERVFVEHLDTCAYRLDAWRLGLATERLFRLRFGDGNGKGGRPGGLHVGAFGWLEDVRPRADRPTPVRLTGRLAEIFNTPGARQLMHDPRNGGYVHAPSLDHATTAALLRTGYLADATPDNPGTMAVNLTSERVRVALSFLEGLRAGQPLGALLGHRLERGLHDRHGVVEIDGLIASLREAFPLVTGKVPDAEPPPGTPIEELEARNVVDGLALVRHVSRTGQRHYPFGKSLPPATQAQRDAIDAEVARLEDIQDAIADLAVAEGVHQAAIGNPDASAAVMDAFTKAGFPPDPAVVRTPRSGIGLNHRVGLHLKPGLSPTTSPVSGLAMTPRGRGEPALNDWLATLLPAPSDVACLVTWVDPVSGAPRERVVTQAELGLQPIDLLWTLRPADEAAMTDLDDRVAGRVIQAAGPRPDAELIIHYTRRIPGKTTFFELSPLVAALRRLLVDTRSLRPSDLLRPASGETPPAGVDDSVTLPRARPDAVRDALNDLGSSVDAFAGDLSAAAEDPEGGRAALLSGVDTFAARLAGVFLTAGGFGLVRSGFGEFAQWRREAFRGVLSAVAAVAARLEDTLAAADAKIAAYDALPGTASEEERFAPLQQAERLLTTSPTSPRPPTAAQLRAIVAGRRAAFAGRLSGVTAIAGTTRTTLSALLSDVTALLPLTDIDPEGLDLTPHEDAVVAFCMSLLSRARDLRAEVTERLAAADAALDAYDGAPGGAGQAEAGIAAIRAMLGPDAVASTEFTVDNAFGNDWRTVLHASENGQLTDHLDRDLPVDDWLHGLARVRPRLAQWERVTLLAGAVGRREPNLVPVQFPYRTGDPWLGLEIPPDHTIDGDRLLYTAHYGAPFQPNATQCAVLIDEWPEKIPATTETTGITFHHDKPGAEPPQTMLLVAPPEIRGRWEWDDLVTALHETLDLAKSRAVEPVHVDRTAYAQLLPATVMTATPHPITISTDLAANNDLPPARGPFRPPTG